MFEIAFSLRCLGESGYLKCVDIFKLLSYCIEHIGSYLRG